MKKIILLVCSLVAVFINDSEAKEIKGNELFISVKDTDSIKKPFFQASEIFHPLTDGMGYHNYRIPSLIATQKGTLLAIMEGREDLNFDHAKNDIVLKRSTDNGASWSKPKVLAQVGDNVVMNPVIVQAENGTIIMVYIYFPEKRHSSDRAHGVKAVDPGITGNTVQKIFTMTSHDEGQTWSNPKEITSIAKKSKKSMTAISGPGVGITLKRGKYKGRVVIPMSERIKKGNEKTAYNYALYSDDHGNTWKHGRFFPESESGNSGGNEIQMIELSNGDILASVRQKDFRLLTKSSDGGNTWSPLTERKDLPDTGCMSPLLSYPYKSKTNDHVLIHNLVTSRVNGRRRGKSVIYLSYDDGNTWQPQKTLYNKGFDYSSLVVLPDGNIGMLAEYDFNGDRAKIKFVKFNMAWVLSKEETVSIEKKVVRPEVYFKTHPNHIIPKDMVIQRFMVDLKTHYNNANEHYTHKYELIEKQGDAKLLNASNINQFSSDNTNTFLADWYGANIIKVTVKDEKGEVITSKKDTVFVHFSHAKLAGGDINNLDKAYKGKEYITGKIIDDSLVYQGMRFLPSDISKGDKRYEGTKFGAYETKEPRVLALKNGTLIASYHFQVKGKNDAPPGLTLVMTRSLDGGKTWVDDQILLQDINGVVAYTSMVQWKDEVHCYFSGGHASHQHANKYKGVYRAISKDDGKTWSKPKPMDAMTKLISTKIDTIAPDQSPNTNALFVPNMIWKGQKANAYIVPFYVHPVKFLITLDGGKTWDKFFDISDYPEQGRALNELSWVLLDNRTIYVVSRRQSKEGYKNEMLLDLKGNPTFLGQKGKNHKARRCHQGAIKIPEGNYKGRVAVASNFSKDREEATVAISQTPEAKKFTTKFLTTNTAWGYCHIDWNPKLNGFILVGESEPYNENEQAVDMDGGPDRNERYSIESFAFSPSFYETLVHADIHK